MEKQYSTLAKMAKNSYQKKAKSKIDGIDNVIDTPTFDVYFKDETIIISIRGTHDFNDIIADYKITVNELNDSTRFKKD